VGKLTFLALQVFGLLMIVAFLATIAGASGPRPGNSTPTVSAVKRPPGDAIARRVARLERTIAAMEIRLQTVEAENEKLRCGIAVFEDGSVLVYDVNEPCTDAYIARNGGW
jgi:hypothetical protein